MMNNLSKTFRYVNEVGDELVFIPDNGFLINKPIGIDTVSVNLTQTQGVNQVGSTIQNAAVQSRPVNISGILFGDNLAEKKESLLAVVRPDISAKLYADNLYLNVRPTATPTVSPEKGFSNFSFSVLSAYPYWLSATRQKTTLVGIEYGFKFPVNWTKPYWFGKEIESQFVNVFNPGKLPVPFTLTIICRRECVNPKVTNIVTGEYLAIDKTLGVNEFVTVDITHDRVYVTSSSVGDIRGALTLRSSLTRLQPGDNILKTEAESGRDDLEVYVQFAVEYLGVTL